MAGVPAGVRRGPIRPGGDAASAQEIQHRLPHLEGWLDHIVGLGLNGLQLGPVFASSTHGYDTVDFFRIDPRLGDEADFRSLVTGAKERGIRILLDGVFNHVSRSHPAFRALEAEGPDASTAGLFRVDWTGWTQGAPVPADVFEGHGHLVAFDHSSPAVEDLVVDVMTHWLERGADGWRLDAAYAVPPEFWARVLPRVRERFPDAWFSGEILQGDTASFVERSTVDSTTQYELWQGVWHGLLDRNLFELAHALKRNNELLATSVPSTFVGNHDVTRIATAVGDARHVLHAVAVLFTVAVTPSVYAGDEYGYRAVKEERLGGDDAIRPVFPASPPEREALDDEANRILAATEVLIALRRRHPWLHRAHTDVVHLSNTAIVLRTATGSDAVVTALNLEDEEVVLPVAGAARVEAGEASLDGASLRLTGTGGRFSPELSASFREPAEWSQKGCPQDSDHDRSRIRAACSRVRGATSCGLQHLAERLLPASL